jgi:hypothetical protein
MTRRDPRYRLAPALLLACVLAIGLLSVRSEPAAVPAVPVTALALDAPAPSSPVPAEAVVDASPWAVEADGQVERLPVFRLRGPQVDRGRARQVFRDAMGVDPTEQESPQMVSYRSGRRMMDVEKRSGHVFMADLDALWNPQGRGNVPDQAQARRTADRFLQENRLLPQASERRVRASYAHTTESGVSEDAPGPVHRQILDRQVVYGFEIVFPGPGGRERAIPVYGGGGKLKVAVGPENRVIGYSGGWREIESVEAEAEVMGQSAAESRFRAAYPQDGVRNVRARLAYYAAPGFEEQRLLAPVWVVSGEVSVAGEMSPTREVVIPATSHGPNLDSGPPPQPQRTGREPAPAALARSSKPTLGRRFHDLIAPPAHAQTRRCGTSWIGTSQGLPGSSGNKQGFVDQCRAAGWTIGFDYGDQNAWESDWLANDDSYVDNVDLVFYTGHASPNGWNVFTPNATSVSSSSVNVTGIDHWGNSRLRWLIVAACGPHQSTHFTTGTTNAFDRWRNVFDGLNIFLGYGAVTNDNTTEGRRFMELTRAGWGVIDAWFRTAWEVQPTSNGWTAPNGPTIYVTAMYAHNGDHCQANERLYGMGPTCPSVVGSTQKRTLIWSGT